MKNFFKKIIVGTPIEHLIRTLLKKPIIKFKDSGNYWENRYSEKNNSGSGSYGRLSEFKANIINQLVYGEKIKSVIEFGCGDGNQLKLSNYPYYTGFDVSNTALIICRKIFYTDKTKKFLHIDQYMGQSAELTLSLDVIYHLIEDDVYKKYMNNLFKASKKFVIIYSTNYNSKYLDITPHVRHRCFSEWIDKNFSEYKLIKKIPNKYPGNKADLDNTSFADFFIYKKNK